MAVKKLYFAPMEGVAGYIFRNIYADFFDDADKFFSPFVVTRPSGIMKNKELRDILPENNEKLFLVPQILANNADGFINASKQMRGQAPNKISDAAEPHLKNHSFLRRTV